MERVLIKMANILINFVTFFKNERKEKVKRILWPQADIVSNGDFIKVQTYSDLGLSTLDHLAPAHVLAPDASDEDLGHALLAALSLSRLLDFDDPAYTDEVVEERYKEWIHDMMKSYGYKTERALFRKMDTCGAMIRDGVLTIRPSYHYALGGWSGDFITEEDYIKIPENSPATAVGAALRLALGRCKTKGF